jgi:peptide/nickel transport system permease protein
VTGDLGRSDEYHRPVLELLLERVWNTLTLSVTALVLTWSVALTLGTLAARWPYSRLDKGSGLLAYTGLSMPAILSSLLALLLAYWTGWFPIGDLVSTGHEKLSFAGRLADRAWHLILPASVITFASMAGYMRQMRASMIETLNQDYIRTARAKGLGERAVLFRHAFRNAINPLITLFGYSLGFLLSGSFIVEHILNWPGMARLTVSAIQAQDEPMVMGAVLMAALLLVAGNLIADLLLGAVDPRIRLEGH